jgi:hypothetical protein
VLEVAQDTVQNPDLPELVVLLNSQDQQSVSGDARDAGHVVTFQREAILWREREYRASRFRPRGRFKVRLAITQERLAYATKIIDATHLVLLK